MDTENLIWYHKFMRISKTRTFPAFMIGFNLATILYNTICKANEVSLCFSIMALFVFVSGEIFHQLANKLDIEE